MKSISFTEENICDWLNKAEPGELDDLDFGVVRLNHQGEVTAYNQYEAELANLNIGDVIGKKFFTQIAPCANNFLVAAKYMENPQKRDEIIDYIFTYRIQPTPVKLRLLIDPEQDNQYMLVKRAA